MKSMFAAGIAALFVAAPAFAQDNYGYEPAYDRNYDQAYRGGLRLEGRVSLDDVIITLDGEPVSKAGVGYGGEAGYDFRTSGVVLGVYGGFEGSSVKLCSDVFGNDEACLKANRNITAGGRIGIVLGRDLLYVKGGYSNGRLTSTYRDFTTPANNGSSSVDVNGFHVGGGYELNFSANTYAKAEYVYTHYSAERTLGIGVGFERHQGTAGLGVRF